MQRQNYLAKRNILLLSFASWCCHYKATNTNTEMQEVITLIDKILLVVTQFYCAKGGHPK